MQRPPLSASLAYSVKTDRPMSDQTQISQIVAYFEEYIFNSHIESLTKKHAQLKSYNVNPIVVRYLSELIEGCYSPMGVAKALFYPRVLGTSINTSFGTRVQNMFVDLKLGGATGSLIKGMDIEFIDKLDQRKKWCQLKSGPNTINSEDVAPLIKKFDNTIRLAKTNNVSNIVNTDFVVGIIYGTSNELSQHYKRINATYPVYIGAEFWYHLTGDPSFYDNLIVALYAAISNLNTQIVLTRACEMLAQEIAQSELFDF